MSRHQIDYESLAQDAMRGLVRSVLQRVARSGLPGDHHFYISFHTRAAGVTLSKRLIERYPDEMTIVLQNKFSDLKALDERFEVTLWFDSIPERLIIPYTAIKVFFDPSVPFGHQFEVAEAHHGSPHAPVLIDRRNGGGRAPAERPADSRPAATQGPAAKPATLAPVKPEAPRPAARPAAPAGHAPVPAPVKPAPESAAASPKPGPKPVAAQTTPSAPKEPLVAKPAETTGAPPASPAEATPGNPEHDESGKVVPLDAFRKKS